ncbi:MAG: polymerase, sigma-24 subunit, subfamily [Verrucomicrobiales bacterium]|nr:polymerase, sigma-24 subunit, subfamily [Verrucomicrobiales bacterium]
MVLKAETEFIPTRQSLLSRLRDLGDEESWQDFFNTYWRLIYNTASKAGLSDVEAQDVVQETVIAVSKSITDFRYDRERGSFKGWLLNQTKWRIADELRLRRRHRRDCAEISPGSGDDELILELPDPQGLEIEKIWDKEWDSNLLETALERVKGRVHPKHFQVFDLYVLREWPVSRVAHDTGFNRMQVYLIKHRISGFLRKEIKAVEAALP